MIVNLVGNAIKFTEQGSIDLAVRLENPIIADEDLTLHFQVCDTGIGIPTEKMELIFDAFTQVDMSTTREFGGTGLGLAISNQLVRMMNGRIWCEHNRKTGSCFHFTAQFPVAGELSSPAQLESVGGQSGMAELVSQSNGPDASGIRVLVAEDSHVNQKLIVAFLQKMGHHVRVANNGAEAVSLWKNSPEAFDIILMDVLMPQMDGLAATAAIRKIEQGNGRHIPIIAVTAQAMQGDREACLNAGMDDYLTKPIRRQQLKAIIQHYCQTS